jgi:hypothetical protein
MGDNALRSRPKALGKGSGTSVHHRKSQPDKL